MKISYKHILENIKSNPDIDELSEKLFQLGHEHEILGTIFDFEFTPNRGDCLSVKGVLRDLKLFYEVDVENKIYDEAIKPFELNFKNNAKKHCKKISFLKIEVDKIPSIYSDCIENYFNDLDIKKNNFFADMSNYISYETGQPTHCYDFDKFPDELKLDFTERKSSFETLIDGKNIELIGKNLVFLDQNNEVINLAGVIGGNSTACNKQTKTAIIECAHFDPEIIMGKSLKFSINSEAAHKFERNVDQDCHDYVLRRFIYIIKNHTTIKNIEIFNQNELEPKIITIPYSANAINKILGVNLSLEEITKLLSRLGFKVYADSVGIPSYRNDVRTINDISEEIARAVGYNNIESKNFNISFNKDIKINQAENYLKNALVDNGFHEVINDPFVSVNKNNSISVDNPLDTNRSFLRLNLKDSLIKNLAYNENRQQDSIKLFEIADIYTCNSDERTRMLSIIASGRVDKNYLDFSKKIDDKYILNILKEFIRQEEVVFKKIPREEVNSKSNNHISFCNVIIDSSLSIEYENYSSKRNISNLKYKKISDFPSSIRDLSFSIQNYSQCKDLEDLVLNFKDILLKDVYIFDYYNNTDKCEIKLGFRFVFQSINSTITDSDVNKVMEKIISAALQFDSVKIPGMA